MRTHPVNVAHLVMGLVFLGIVAAWALAETGVVEDGEHWLLPVVLVVAGAAGLVASVARGLGRGDDQHDDTAGEPPDHELP